MHLRVVGRRVHSSFRSCTPARLGVFGFIRVRVSSLGVDYGSSGLFKVAWIHSGVVGFAWVHSDVPSGRRIHSAPNSRRVHSCSRGFTWARLVVAGFIRVRLGSPGRALGSSDSFELASNRSGAPREPRVHSGSRGFTRTGLVVDGFIQVRLGSFWRD